MVNTIPPKIDLYADGGDGTTPLIFNRTETNQQYINLTMSDKIDSINILANEMFMRRPEGKGKLLDIRGEASYLEFTGHPKTVKIFKTDLSMIGESTFSEIFVNCNPEEIRDKDIVVKNSILGIGIQFMDKVLRIIYLDKILKPVPSSSDESAGDKNEILIDFRIGF